MTYITAQDSSDGLAKVIYQSYEMSLYSTSYDNWQAIHGAAIHSIKVDPLLADPINYYFSLKSNSSCIDSGIYVGLSKDFNGTPLPHGFGVDLGVVEFIGLSVPKNLRIQ